MKASHEFNIMQLPVTGSSSSHDCKVTPHIESRLHAGEKMEFSEASKANALKFLEGFVSNELPLGSEDPPPIRPNWPLLEEGEVEAECLEMTRRYLPQKLVRSL